MSFDFALTLSARLLGDDAPVRGRRLNISIIYGNRYSPEAVS